jgi:hypothetical protein
MTGPARRRWTSDEDKELMLDAGRIAPEIALKLNRTPQAIYARLQRLYRKRMPSAKTAQHSELELKAKGNERQTFALDFYARG